jgi:hypothetical protein
VIETFDRWDVSLAGLFTFPHSFKHLTLYQKFGFWPHSLTPVLAKPVHTAAAVPPGARWHSTIPQAERAAALDACAELTSAVYDGLDLRGEIAAVLAQKLGETVILDGPSGVEGLAICHVGAGSLGGSETCYMLFGAVRPGAAQAFERLLSARESYAASQHATTITAGVCSARREARALLARGFRAQFVGVVMHRPDQPGYNRPDSFVIDDWR